MKTIFFSLLFFIFALESMADYRGIIQFSKDEVVPGEVQQAKMLLISNDKSQVVMEYLKHKEDPIRAGEDIEIIGVENIKLSENNHDVIESDILILLKKVPKEINPTLEILNDHYNLEFRDLKVKKIETPRPKEMVVISTSYSFPFEMNVFWALLIAFIVIAAYFTRRFFLKYKIRRKNYLLLLKKRDTWRNLFLNCHERNQFEYIVQNFSSCKNDLHEIYCKDVDLSEKQKLLESFYNKNIDYFYQMRWEPETQKKIDQSFNLVREVFNGEFRI